MELFGKKIFKREGAKAQIKRNIYCAFAPL